VGVQPARQLGFKALPDDRRIHGHNIQTRGAGAILGQALHDMLEAFLGPAAPIFQIEVEDIPLQDAVAPQGQPATRHS